MAKAVHLLVLLNEGMMAHFGSSVEPSVDGVADTFLVLSDGHDAC